jgi:hypothetical protein
MLKNLLRFAVAFVLFAAHAQEPRTVYRGALAGGWARS